MMGWWKGVLTLSLVASVTTLQAREGLRAPQRSEIRAAAKEKEKASALERPVIIYRNGVVPWRGARVLGFTPTQVLETFDNGIDTTSTGLWESILDGNGDGVTWDTASSVPGSPGSDDFPNPPGAVYDDDAAGSGAGPGVEALTTKAIDFTMYQSGDTVLLSFFSNFQIHGAGGGEYAALAVQPYISGVWGNWDTVWVHIGSDRKAQELVDLSLYAIADSIKLSFAFVDTSGEWGWGWGIDDIALGTYTPDVFLSQNFEACTMPAGWTTVDGNGDGFTWTVGTTTDLGLYQPPNRGTCYAYYSDDDAGTGRPAGTEWLISPAVPLSGFMGALGLSYDFGFRIISATNESTYVYVRTHDGTAWGAWTEVVAYGGANMSRHEDLDISVFLPAESIQVAFVYKDRVGGWYWAVGVDNVTLYGRSPLKDVGVVFIEPGASGLVPPSFTPRVVVKNFGLTHQSYKVHFKIEDFQGNTLYEDSTTLAYRHSGSVDTVNFAPYSASLGDMLVLTAWTDLADDNPGNDMLSYTVVAIYANDAAVLSVAGPAYGDPLFSYTFDVTVENQGGLDLANVDVRVDILDQATNTVVHSEVLNVGSLASGTQAVVTTAPFQPPAANANYTVVAYLLTADENSANNMAQSVFSTQIAPVGTDLAVFTFPSLPAYDLAGITYREDNQKFYVVSMSTPGVYEFDPVSGTLNLLFTTNDFGAPLADIPWGIAYDPTDTTLWLTQIGINTSGVQYLYGVHYDFTGTVLGTVDLLALTGQGYIAGMDYFPRTFENGELVGGYFWAVGVATPTWGAMPNIWKLDLHNGTVVGQVPNPDPLPYRGVAYYARGVNLVFLGGWNQNAVQVWDSNLSSQLASYAAPDVADFDLWEDLNHYQALIVQTHNDPDNTIRVVALGMPWMVDVSEKPAPAVVSFAPRGISRGMAVATLALPAAADVKAEVFDATGRRVAQVFAGRLSAGVHELRFNAPRAGLYFWKVKAGDRTFQAKTVVVK